MEKVKTPQGISKAKLPKLTRKQKGFVKDYLETENATEAAARNYDVANRNVANNIGAENLAKPSIRVAIQELLPDELLAKVHLEGLAATNVRFTPEGERIDVQDFATRHKYLDSSYKLKGSYAAEKSINLNIDMEPTERLKELAKKLIELDNL